MMHCFRYLKRFRITCLESWIELPELSYIVIYIYVYIYMYICVCMCSRPGPPSGIGTAEEACRAILKHFQQQMQTEQRLPLAVEHASDAERMCRYVLMQHEGECQPMCLFGDILDRAPEHALDILRQRHQQCLDNLDLNGKKRKMNRSKHTLKQIRDVGREFITDAVQLLLENLPSRKPHVRAHCYVHGSSCRLRVRPHKADAGPVPSTCVSIAGFSCVDWS